MTALSAADRRELERFRHRVEHSERQHATNVDRAYRQLPRHLWAVADEHRAGRPSDAAVISADDVASRARRDAQKMTKADRRALLLERGWERRSRHGAEGWVHEREGHNRLFTLTAATRRELEREAQR